MEQTAKASEKKKNSEGMSKGGAHWKASLRARMKNAIPREEASVKTVKAPKSELQGFHSTILRKCTLEEHSTLSATGHVSSRTMGTLTLIVAKSRSFPA